ncbi:MAG: aldo/keto reductase [Rhizobium sp.]|nr:aldo/keto reductase [Rhizobium sp.]
MNTTRNTGRPVEDLVLGTAQFGLCYGLANQRGKPDIGTVSEILDLAFDLGIRLLDTAKAYGESEANLGACGMQRWSTITKVPSLRNLDDADLGATAHDAVLRSLETLGIEKLHAVLAHDRRDAVGERGRRLQDALAPLVASGHIGKIGVSVYGPEDMDGIDARNAQIVQAPLNVFDQRFITSGAASRLSAAGGELHVRSVFLQGLLLMPAQERPARFAPWAEALARFDGHVEASGLDPAAYCLGFAASQATVTRCVIGVDTPQQLSQLVAAFEAGQRAGQNAHDLRSGDPGLIDPRQWETAT